MSSEPLWGKYKLPVIGVTGERYVGKTLFLLGIDPENCLLIDTEHSSASYVDVPVKKRIDMYAEMRDRSEQQSQAAQADIDLWKKHGVTTDKTAPPVRYDFRPIDCFIWFRDMVEAVPPGLYTNVCVDVISDIEEGLADWVKCNPQFFKRSPAQYEKAPGLYWQDVNSYWKMFLGRIAAKVETFAYSTHMRNRWVGGVPTTQREPKGKKVLQELSSLFLTLKRDTKDKDQINPPYAIVDKCRLSQTIYDKATGKLQVVPILPDRVPNISAYTIREYIKNPVNPGKLKPEEILRSERLSEDEKLMIQAETAAMELNAAEIQERREEKQAERTEKRWEDFKKKETESHAKEQADDAEDQRTPQDKLAAFIDDIGLSDEDVATILAKRKVETIEALTDADASEIHRKLWNKHTATQTQNLLTGEPK